MKNLAQLLASEIDFDQAFQAQAKATKSAPRDHLDVLIQQSRTFRFNETEFSFDEDDKIFFLSGPNPAKNMVPKCTSCFEPFKDYKNVIYCTFCSLSACKKCTKKTRLYPLAKPDPDIDKKKREEVTRGKICRLCDRKFLIKQMLVGSSQTIKMHNDVIQNAIN